MCLADSILPRSLTAFRRWLSARAGAIEAVLLTDLKLDAMRSATEDSHTLLFLESFLPCLVGHLLAANRRPPIHLELAHGGCSVGAVVKWQPFLQPPARNQRSLFIPCCLPPKDLSVLPSTALFG